MLELKNTSVRQHNNFVSSPYATEFSLHELKIVEYIIADCKEIDQDKIKLKIHKSYTFTPTQLAKILNTSVSRIVTDADKLADEITKKRIIKKTYDTEGNIVDFEYITIIPVAKYSNGQFRFDFNYEILNFFIDINKNFTEFQLRYLLGMRSAHSMKLYKLLYQYKKIKKRLFFIEELKEQFGISDKYPQYKNFKQKVIDPSIKQINELTDLNVTYNEIKIGRSVSKLEFNFDVKRVQASNMDKNSQIRALNYSEVTEFLKPIESELSTQTKELLSKYLREKGTEYIDACICYAKRNAKTNFDKYLADTLTNGWAEVEIKKSKAKKATETAKVVTVKKESDKKKMEKEQENLAKSEIEHMWSKLLDFEKQPYLSYSEFILNKYASKLTSLPTLDQRLPLCIYAVSNNKFYDRTLELYLKNMLNISLNINDYKI